MKIGISWRAGGQPGERRMRTTSLDLWRRLLAVRGATFINLQYGDCVDEIADMRRETGIEIHDWADADPLVDMDAFAAKVAAVDLVVSVDNSTVHLSGALGVPTWLVLPQAPGWRWSIADFRSVWYPSLRLFRQTQRGEWPAVFEHVGRMLAKIAGSPDPSVALTVMMEEAAGITGQSSSDFSSDAGRSSAKHTSIGTRLIANGHAIEMPSDGATSAEVGWAETIRAAQNSYEQGDFAEAESLCRRVLSHSPRNLQATNLLGVLAGQTGRLDLAIRTLGRAAALAGDDAVVALNMAAALTDSGKYDLAIDAYRRVILQQPELYDAHVGHGKALQVAAEVR